MFDYNTLKNLPEKISMMTLLEFLNRLGNASLSPSDPDSGWPPIMYWWFYEENDEVDALIADSVKSYPWKEEWILQVKHEKWLLYPRRLRKLEQKIRNIANEEDVITFSEAKRWLMENDPEFGKQTSRELEEFTKYFRNVVERYLQQKELNHQK